MIHEKFEAAKGKQAEKSFIFSPLLNLAAAAPTGATLRQRCSLVPLAGSAIEGTAILSLTPDRLTLSVTLQLKQAQGVAMAICRLVEAERDEEDLCILEIADNPSAPARTTIECSFALANRGCWGPVDQRLAGQRSSFDLKALRASAIEGLSLAPAASLSREDVTPFYFRERMLTELAAAEIGATAISTSRHVELANLYARKLRHIG